MKQQGTGYQLQSQGSGWTVIGFSYERTWEIYGKVAAGLSDGIVLEKIKRVNGIGLTDGIDEGGIRGFLNDIEVDEDGDGVSAFQQTKK